MKVLARYCKQWANFSTRIIVIIDGDTLKTLERKIAEAFQFTNEKLILKLDRDGFCLRLCHNFPLSFYEFEEKSVLTIEKIEDTQEIDSGQRISHRYFEKLGLLKPIQEVDEEEIEALQLRFSNSLIKTFEPLENCSLVNKFSIVRKFSLPYMNFESQNKNLETFIKAAKLGFLEDVRGFSDISDLINKSSKNGWNALHYAIFHRHHEVALFLINKGANLNAITHDGWSPLQLCIYQNQQIIFNKILSSSQVDIDLMTSKGSALHLACRLNKFIFANGLMNANSDCELKNNDGYLPVDLTTNEEIVKLFHYKIKKTKDNQSKSQINLTSLNSDNNYPEKPPIIKGEMYKIGEMRIALNRRFFVLNAEEGTLIRFMKKSDFPLKPLEILPLKDIETIKKIKKPWCMRKDYHFFKIKYAGKKQILSCKHKCTMKLWINYIHQAVIYSVQIDIFLQKL